MLAGDATDQTPPDLPSFLFKERIVYLVRTYAMCCISPQRLCSCCCAHSHELFECYLY
jgi:hypothetical protein